VVISTAPSAGRAPVRHCIRLEMLLSQAVDSPSDQPPVIGPFVSKYTLTYPL